MIAARGKSFVNESAFPTPQATASRSSLEETAADSGRANQWDLDPTVQAPGPGAGEGPCSRSRRAAAGEWRRGAAGAAGGRSEARAAAGATSARAEAARAGAVGSGTDVRGTGRGERATDARAHLPVPRPPRFRTPPSDAPPPLQARPPAPPPSTPRPGAGAALGALPPSLSHRAPPHARPLAPRRPPHRHHGPLGPSGPLVLAQLDQDPTVGLR